MVPQESVRTTQAASRREFLAGIGLAVSGCVAPTGPAQSGGGEAAVWTSFGQNAGNTRSGRGTGGTSGDPSRVWRAPLNGNLWSAPTVTESTVFSTGGNRVFAFDRSSGNQQWVNQTSGKTGYFSPSVADGRVFVGVQQKNTTHLVALDASDGTREWTIEAPVSSYSNVVDETVYVETASGQTQTIQALNATTGEKRWGVSVPRSTAGRISPAPAIADGRVYSTATASGRIHLYALDVATGDRLWHRATDGRSEMSPAVSDGTVFFGNRRGSLHAYNGESGEKQWRAKTDAPIRSNPVVTAERAYVGDALGTLYAFDRAAGDRRWTARTQMVNSTPAVASDCIYTGGTALLCLDRASGDQQWDYNIPTHSSSFFSPIPVEDSVFAGVCLKTDPKDPYDNYVYRIG